MQPEPTIDGWHLYSGLPQPEPVAFVVYDSESNDIVWTKAGMHLKQNTPLYTAPPQREWVGLTKEEVELWELPASPTVYEFALFVEAKLKEKNSTTEKNIQISDNNG
jgi:hypothetical protein